MLETKFKIHGGLHAIVDWKLDHRVRDRLQGTCFENFTNVKEKLYCCHPLMKAMIKYFDVETEAFVFNGHHLSFGLEDIYYLTGLPINGRPVSGSCHSHAANVLELLGKTDYQCRDDKQIRNSISLSRLRMDFGTDEVPPDASDEALDMYARAFVLYVIGNVINTDEHHGQLPTIFLPLVKNINEIGTYSWGAAILANINYLIKKYQKNPTNEGIHGPLIFLQLFALERFRWLREFTYANPVDHKLAFPLMKPWTEELGHYCRNTMLNRKEDDFFEFFRQVTEDQITMRPYVEVEELLPHSKDDLVL